MVAIGKAVTSCNNNYCSRQRVINEKIYNTRELVILTDNLRSPSEISIFFGRDNTLSFTNKMLGLCISENVNECLQGSQGSHGNRIVRVPHV